MKKIKKLGLKFKLIIENLFFIILFLILGTGAKYLVFANYINKNIIWLFNSLSIFFFLLALIFALKFYIIYKLNEPIILKENEIYLKRKNISISFNEIKNFYFTPNKNNEIKFLVIEKMNKEKFIFKRQYIGEDFLNYFKNRYFDLYKDEYVDKLNHNYDLNFGILSKNQQFFIKLINLKSTSLNLIFDDSITLNKNSIVYQGRIYNLKNLNFQFLKNKFIITDTLNETEIITILESHIEKGDFLFKLLCLITEQDEHKQLNEKELTSTIVRKNLPETAISNKENE